MAKIVAKGRDSDVKLMCFFLGGGAHAKALSSNLRQKTQNGKAKTGAGMLWVCLEDEQGFEIPIQVDSTENHYHVLQPLACLSFKIINVQIAEGRGGRMMRRHPG